MGIRFGLGRARHYGMVLACLGLCTIRTPAQTETDGAIAGRLVDAAGNSVAAAQVVVRQVETGIVERAQSGRNGEFVVARLPAGDYQLTVAQAHTAIALADTVAVTLGQVTEAGSLELREDTIKVRDDSDSGDSGGELPQTKIDVLPINAGDWRSLAVAFSDANAAAEGDDDPSLTFRGIAATQNTTRIDGLSADDSFTGRHIGAGVAEDTESGTDIVYDSAAGAGSGPKSVADGGQRAGAAYTFAQAGVREFRIQGQGEAAAYGSALYGHSVGGVVTTASRAGTTRLHAMAFYTLRESAWAATNPFSIATTYNNGTIASAYVKPQDIRRQFGGSVGGPLGSVRHQPDLASLDAHPRAYFFYAFDQQQRNFPAISTPGYAGFYSLTPSQTALLGNRGVTAAKTNAALNYLASLTGTVPRTASQTVNFGRIDWHSRPGRVVLEFNSSRWDSPSGARSGAVVDRAVDSLGSSFGEVEFGVLRLTNLFRHGFSNELRGQYGHELLYETPQKPLAQEPAIGPGDLPPEVSIGPQGFVFGTPASLGQRAYPEEQRLEVADDFGWLHGRHFFQVGGDISTVTDTTSSLTNAEGTFSYDSSTATASDGGIVNWITDYTFGVNAYPNGGCPSITAAAHSFCFRSYSQSFGQQNITFGTGELAAFAQDDWRVSQNLALHAGMRYEYESLPAAQQPNAALDAAFGNIGASNALPDNRANFGPRLGLEWSPFGAGHGLIRAGYGVYFGKLPGATIRAALLDTAQPGSVTRIRILPTTETTCPQNVSDGFGYPCSFVTPPTGVVAATTSAMVFDRSFHLPMVQQGTFSLERELIAGLLGSTRYVLNLDRQLPDSVDINIAPTSGYREFQLQGGTGAVGARDGEVFYVPAYSSRLNTSFGPVTDIVSHANASYNGFTLEVRRGLGSSSSDYNWAGRALDLRVAWTWSKAIDFGQNSGAVPRTNGQFDPFSIRYDKGLSALNFPHHIVATAVWTPRIIEAGSGAVPTAERTILRLFDSWSIAGIFTETSGRGYSYEIFGGTRLNGGRESINGSGGSTVLPTSGRNTLRLPDFTNLDLRLSRPFQITEALHLRASIEAFNALNHVNYSGITQRAYVAGTAVSGITPLVFQDAAAVAAEGLNVQPFGAYTASGINEARERHLQASLKLEF